MREEINGQEPALNDAELASVSGGDHPKEEYEVMVKADRICQACMFSSEKHCSVSYKSSYLEDYLKEHGKDSVKGHLDCPYYRP